jgi:hypothetical protein
MNVDPPSPQLKRPERKADHSRHLALRLMLVNGSANTPVARQWLSSRHVITATDTHAIMEAVFTVWSVPRLYNEGQLPLRESPETAVRREGGWCEMAASLRGHEPGSRGTSTVGSRYQAAE